MTTKTESRIPAEMLCHWCTRVRRPKSLCANCGAVNDRRGPKHVNARGRVEDADPDGVAQPVPEPLIACGPFQRATYVPGLGTTRTYAAVRP